MQVPAGGRLGSRGVLVVGRWWSRVGGYTPECPAGGGGGGQVAYRVGLESKVEPVLARRDRLSRWKEEPSVLAVIVGRLLTGRAAVNTRSQCH